MTMEPTRDEVDQMTGLTVLEFGADWCPHCQAIQSAMASHLSNHSGVHHIKVEDGKGKRLGRSFRVKLWPTLVFMKDGQVVGQFIRPTADQIAEAFAQLVR